MPHPFDRAVIQVDVGNMPLFSHTIRPDGKTVVFTSNRDGAMNQLFAEFFPSAPPARATPIVSLPRGLRISIDATVFVG